MAKKPIKGGLVERLDALRAADEDKGIDVTKLRPETEAAYDEFDSLVARLKAAAAEEAAKTPETQKPAPVMPAVTPFDFDAGKGPLFPVEEVRPAPRIYRAPDPVFQQDAPRGPSRLAAIGSNFVNATLFATIALGAAAVTYPQVKEAILKLIPQ